MSMSVMRGLSDENGSWKIICIWRRSGRSSLLGIFATSTWRPPSVRKRMAPAVGVSARKMQREVVVLPQPDLPTSESVSPFWMSKLTSSTART